MPLTKPEQPPEVTPEKQRSSGLPLKTTPLEASHSEILLQTKRYGRCACVPGTSDSGATLEPIPSPTGEPRTKRQVLQERLKHVRRLKRQYMDHYKASLAHVPDMATSLYRAQQKLVYQSPDKRVRKSADATAAAWTAATTPKKPSHARSFFDSGLVLGYSVDDGMSPALSSKPLATSPQPKGTIEALPTFSDVEVETIEAVTAENQGSPRPGSGCSLAACQAALGRSLEGIGDHERVAAAALALDMDARNACAVLCGKSRRFYIHQTVVLLGRGSKSKGEVCTGSLFCSA
jgi:hypothetical protein